MKHECIKEIKASNDIEINKRFHHKKIKKGKMLKDKIVNGDVMVVTRLGNLICRVNSSMYQDHFKPV